MAIGDSSEGIAETTSLFREHATAAMISINTALQNLLLYPENSPSTVDAVEHACGQTVKGIPHVDALINR